MNYAYVAGLIDADGCIGFGRSRTTVFPRLFVTNTNKQVLEDLLDAFGGDITTAKRVKDNWKTAYHWRLSWSAAVNLLDKISPWLRIKQDQASTIFAWNEIRLGMGKRTQAEMDEYRDTCELLLARMKWLNKKGRHNEPDPILAVFE